MKRLSFIFLAYLIAIEATGEDSIPLSIDLPEITVCGERYLRTADGFNVIPQKEQTRYSSSGYELLRNLMIPGVSVNVQKGEIKALGGATTVFIDGLPADEREIRQLRPSDVLKVQYMDAPTGKYAGNGTVINFVLKKRDTGGYVAMDALQRAGYRAGDYNLAAKLYRNTTQFTLFTGADWKDIRGMENTRHEKILFPGTPVTRDYATDRSTSRHNSQYAQIRIRDKNDNRTLRATLNFVRDAVPQNFTSSTLLYGGFQQEIPPLKSASNSISRNFKYSLGLSGTFNLQHVQFIETSASATILRNHYDYSYSENDNGINSSTLEDYYILTANITYGLKFDRDNSFVLKVSELHNVSSADYISSDRSWQHLWSSETICFCEYMHPLWGKASVRVSPGLSAQFYRLHGKDKIKHIGPRLQLAFTMQPTRKQFIQLLAFYGNSFPQLSMMSTAQQQVDMFQIKRGNPDLKQTGIARMMMAYGIGIGKINLQAAGIYNGAWKLPLAGYYFENGMLIQSFLANGEWRQLDASVSATWVPSTAFNLQGSAGYLYNGYFKAARTSAGCWKGSLNAAWYIGAFAINAHVETPVKTVGYDLVTTRTPWQYGMSASWSIKSLRIEAGTENPFSRHPYYRQTLHTPEYTYSNSSYSPVNRTSAYVKISWSVDFGKKAHRDSRNIDRSISTGVIRAH